MKQKYYIEGILFIAVCDCYLPSCSISASKLIIDSYNFLGNFQQRKEYDFFHLIVRNGPATTLKIFALFKSYCKLNVLLDCVFHLSSDCNQK